MSSDQLWQILFPPGNISVLFGLVLVFGGRLFVELTEYTWEVDPATIQFLTKGQKNPPSQQEVKQAITIYTHDSIWRVSLLTSTLSSFVSLFVMVSTSSILSNFLFLLAILVLLFVIIFLFRNKHPNAARLLPYCDRRFLRWLNPYWAGDLCIAAFQMILFAANSFEVYRKL